MRKHQRALIRASDLSAQERAQLVLTQAEGRPRSGVVLRCQQCGTPFHSYAQRIIDGYGKFCSRNCYAESMRSGEWKDCQNCNEQFWVVPARADVRGGGKYCSRQCKIQGRNGYAPPSERACLVCGDPVVQHGGNATMKAKFCGIEHYHQWCAEQSGKIKHGTFGGYSKGCRCAPCKAKMNATVRSSRRRGRLAGSDGRVERACIECGQSFWAFPSEVKVGKGKYCGRSCASRATYRARTLNQKGQLVANA